MGLLSIMTVAQPSWPSFWNTCGWWKSVFNWMRYRMSMYMTSKSLERDDRSSCSLLRWEGEKPGLGWSFNSQTGHNLLAQPKLQTRHWGNGEQAQRSESKNSRTQEVNLLKGHRPWRSFWREIGRLMLLFLKIWLLHTTLSVEVHLKVAQAEWWSSTFSLSNLLGRWEKGCN